MNGRLGIAAAVVVGVLAVGVTLSVRLARQPLPPVVRFAAAEAPVDNSEGVPADEMRRSLESGREQEAAPMARWPGVARRRGDVLTISAQGRDLASFADGGYCDGYDQCARWRFRGVWTLGGKAYPWLTFFQGEGDEMAYLVDPAGRLVGAPGLPTASPDGRWLIVAYDDPDMDGGLSIFEARPEGLILAADGPEALGCEAGAWRGAARLALTCSVDDGAGRRWMTADLVREGEAWRVRPIAELDAATKKPVVRPPTEPLAEIPIPTVKLDTDAGVDDDAYEVSKGYRRLAPGSVDKRVDAKSPV